jgi:hypothetical protein
VCNQLTLLYSEFMATPRVKNTEALYISVTGEEEGGLSTINKGQPHRFPMRIFSVTVSIDCTPRQT